MARPKADAAREACGYISELRFSDEGHLQFLRACQSVGLTPPLVRALLSMEPGEAKPMGTFASLWHCDASWVTSVVDGLEQRGFVARQVLSTDRRVKTVVLTPTGVEAKAAVLAILHEPPPAMAALTRAEQRTLAALLRKVAEAQRARTG